MKIRRGKQSFSAGMLVLTAIFLIGLIGAYPTFAYAAAVSSYSDALSTIKESVAANHTITFTINDTWSATETLSVDFPDTFVTTGFVNSDDNDFDISDDAVDVEVVVSGGCAANKIEITTVNTSTDTFTFTLCSGSTAIASSSVIVIEIGTNAGDNGTGDTQITNQTATENNSDAIETLGGNFGGSGTAALEIVGDNAAVVTATVDPRITCTFANLTPTFASLTGPVTTASGNTTITITTNAANGFNLTVRDVGNTTNPGLYKSAGSTYLIGSADSSFSNTATLSTDVDGFGIQGSTSGGSGGTVTIAARYNQTSNDVGGLELTDTQLAFATAPVTSRVITATAKAAVSGAAPAGTYTDTLTYVCTGIY